MSTTTIEPAFAPAGAAFDAGETIAHGAVRLDVIDLPRALAFWRDLLGLVPLGGGEADGVARLGAGARELIVLHAGAERRATRRRRPTTSSPRPATSTTPTGSASS